MAGIMSVRAAQARRWSLGDFLHDVLPQASSLVALVSPSSPVQKITARVLNEEGEILGYLKYAERDAARRRLRQEQLILSRLPSEVSPTLLKFGPMGHGEALLCSPLVGAPLRASLPPVTETSYFLRKLVVSSPVSVEAHPWIRALRERSDPVVDPWVQALAGKPWPVVVQHGDFAPWNIVRNPDGALAAVDWEYGSLEGLPNLDLAHYLLQVSALIYRREPRKAMEYAISFLSQEQGLALSNTESYALVHLAAYDWLLKHIAEDGYTPDAAMRAWQKAVYEGPVLNTAHLTVEHTP